MRKPISSLVFDFKGRSPSGVACSFMKIDDEWGIKVYRSEDERDECFYQQKKMAFYGFGPRVGICFQAGDKYCYISQVAIPVADGEDYDEIGKMNKIPQVKKMVRTLIDKMSEVGFDMYDNHAGNFGILNKQIVCIDFGNN